MSPTSQPRHIVCLSCPSNKYSAIHPSPCTWSHNKSAIYSDNGLCKLAASDSDSVMSKLRLSKTERRLLSSSWLGLDSERVQDRVGTAWLLATEQSPTWVWGVIGVSESVQGGAQQHEKFQGLIKQITTFIGHCISLLHTNKDSRFAAACQQLGLRHRHYFIEGHRPAYWVVFCRELRAALLKLIDEYAEQQYDKTQWQSRRLSSEVDSQAHCSRSGPNQSIPPSHSTHTLNTNADTHTSTPTPTARAKSVVPIASKLAPLAAKLPHQQRQLDKLVSVWNAFLDTFFDHLHNGYCGTCAKPGGSVGASLMNMLSMSGMMSSTNTFGQTGAGAGSRSSTALATVMRPAASLRPMPRQGTV